MLQNFLECSRTLQKFLDSSRMFQTFSRKFHNVPEYSRMFRNQISNASACVPESSRMFYKFSGIGNCKQLFHLIITLKSPPAKPGDTASYGIIIEIIEITIELLNYFISNNTFFSKIGLFTKYWFILWQNVRKKNVTSFATEILCRKLN